MLVDGKIQSHVVRYNEILDFLCHSSAEPACGHRSRNSGLGSLGFRLWPRWVSLQLRDKTIEDSRVVFGGISGKPYRETTVGLPQGQNLKHGIRRASGLRLPWPAQRR